MLGDVMNAQNGQNAMVHVENLVKRYRGSERTAVDGISLNDKKECVL
jgi:hypothetical protein